MKRVFLLITIGFILLTGCEMTENEKESDTSENTIDVVEEDNSLEISGKIVGKYYENDIPTLELKEDAKVLILDASSYEDFDLLKEGWSLTAEIEDNKVLKIKEVDENSEMESETEIKEEEDENTKVIAKDSPKDLFGLSEYQKVDLEFFPEYNISSVVLYTDAMRDESGQFMWDDGNEFVLIAHAPDGDYLLLDKRVQIGSIILNVFTADDVLTITVLEYETAGIQFRTYELIDSEFIETIEYQGEGNINMLSGF